ncbi:Uncharacterised protein [Mycobacteroides abscessus subsp. abscessus]|nr:Uncharacterised protein [Mycobacteroides abscessus subsp. abscessus]
MVLDEFVTAVLGFVVGCATIAALYLGLLGMAGAARMVRCTACSHWMVSHTDEAGTCTRCSHPLLWHPWKVLRRRRMPGRGLSADPAGIYGPRGSSVWRAEAGLVRAQADRR